MVGESVGGLVGSSSGGRGAWLKLKSSDQVAQDRLVLADVGPGIRAAVGRGLSREPPRKSSSMNFR